MSEGAESRRCLWCYEELVRREDESQWNFEHRIYCNGSHSGLHIGERKKSRKKNTWHHPDP
jgi:hypothetical protein